MLHNFDRFFRFLTSSRDDQATDKNTGRQRQKPSRTYRLLVEQLEARTLLNSNLSLPFMGGGG